MSDWKPKRFWTMAAAAEVDGGWSVTLDARPVRTPAKALLTVPTRALAEALAEEWQAQDKEVDPNTMPLTRLANSAQDKVRIQHADVAALIGDYGGSDLLCYRAQTPQELVERQSAAWDPLLAWIAQAKGLTFDTHPGVMPGPQPDATMAAVHQMTADLSAHVLTGFHDLVSISGSWIIGFAALSGHQSTDALWDAAHVDETWQAEQWGEDEEALEMRALKHQAFQNAFRFTDLSD